MTTYPTFEDFAAAANSGTLPPPDLDARLRALWLGRHPDGWDAAHDIVNDLASSDGDAIHAWLHLVEGDIPNANYWLHRAHLPPARPADANTLWESLARRCGNW